MRRVFSLISAVILLALVILIIQRRPDDGTPRPERTDSTVATVATTTTLTTDQSAPTSAVPNDVATTDTTEAGTFDTVPEVADDPGLEARFAIRQVVFGDGGYVVITNVGGAAGSVGGYAVCQRPSYLNLPDLVLEPFDSIWVAAGDGSLLTASPAVAVIPANGGLGGFDRSDGEMALYSSPNFGSADAMLSYVEWGSSGHGRSDVAVEAGLWMVDAFVEIPADADSVQAVEQAPDGPEDWVAGLGG